MSDGHQRPQATTKLHAAFKALLCLVFSRTHQADPVLAGSSALAGYYLGHRWPRDIDLFVASMETCKLMLEHLAQRVSFEWHQDPERCNALVAQVVILDASVVLHCIRRPKERWDHPVMAQRYRTACESVQIQTFPYLAFAKLLSLQSESHVPDKRAVSLFDLQSIFLHLTPERLADELSFLATKHPVLAPGIDIEQALLALPNEAVVDGVKRDLAAFHRNYGPRLKDSWARHRLHEALEFD